MARRGLQEAFFTGDGRLLYNFVTNFLVYYGESLRLSTCGHRSAFRQSEGRTSFPVGALPKQLQRSSRRPATDWQKQLDSGDLPQVTGPWLHPRIRGHPQDPRRRGGCSKDHYGSRPCGVWPCSPRLVLAHRTTSTVSASLHARPKNRPAFHHLPDGRPRAAQPGTGARTSGGHGHSSSPPRGPRHRRVPSPTRVPRRRTRPGRNANNHPAPTSRELSFQWLQGPCPARIGEAKQPTLLGPVGRPRNHWNPCRTFLRPHSASLPRRRANRHGSGLRKDFRTLSRQSQENPRSLVRFVRTLREPKSRIGHIGRGRTSHVTASSLRRAGFRSPRRDAKTIARRLGPGRRARGHVWKVVPHEVPHQQLSPCSAGRPGSPRSWNPGSRQSICRPVFGILPEVGLKSRPEEG